ncbi:PAS domain-containing protein [Mycobacterium sp. CBMA293]|uniref:sensor histidine kinase n=1 Tax=unclassified Mycolicibacterium TaxID=2636767 RepID=UPI0013214725|nr:MULTISPECIES: PAS domain-containing sensor histidine kinase [unclassified Mycolicibacterium]MUL46886.1 PAS domain-containing protein [Mycolicibacterium sp. CBMA 360]MUL92416.1 PAS domain-containing protein [Mycolicibacterium sp. CBMA 230]MUL57328.1 PAS domain-containing protein [Mycolicibacterium sp. CBMA 335]MUL70368.1 PAS domain-containing protein [Mycolicibacterium sp. CBMA 311]MUM04338.1 ATPase [Mycolicibacterium sp. CBMA 213]
MSTLGDLLAEHTVLPGNAVDHLHAVVGEWQLLADLSFADYLMWVRRDDGTFVCVAQIRPNTALTVMFADAVGTINSAADMPAVTAAFESGHISRGKENSAEQGDSSSSRLNLEAVPVRYGTDVVAVLTHQTALADRRKVAPLERAYLDCARDLLRMLAEGTFPNVGDVPMSRSSPRVGDGLIRLDVDGVVLFASPNAISAYHRMGLATELDGQNLISVTRPLISDPFDAQELANHVRDLLAGGSSMRMEIDAGGAAVLLRTIPLSVGGKAVGAAVLVRDVTEIKRRDRALLSKDATIREIHHRVKNNLQTVAALLRLQSRRMNNAEAREALLDSVRRVSSIALVHDALSLSVDEEVNLDEVIDRILPMMNDLASLGAPIRVRREGDLGVLDADRAHALIMVITELVQNAIEHAFDPSTEIGSVTIQADRSARWLDVVVHDDGHGLPDGFLLENSDRLGLQIVQTQVSSVLDGTLAMNAAPGGGTDVVLRVPIGRRGRAAQ